MTQTAAFALLLSLLPLPAHAEMRGHGGPVRAIAISPDGKTAVTGSFDTTVIIWDLETETARQVLRHHEGPVNAVRMVPIAAGPDQRFAHGLITGGDDGRVAFWEFGQPQPTKELPRQAAPVVAIEIPAPHRQDLQRQSGRNAFIGYADGTLGLQHTGGGDPKFTRHLMPSTAIAMVRTSAGDIVIASNSQKLHWAGTSRSFTLPANANTLAAAPDGEIVAGGADGKVYMLDATGAISRSVEVQELPVTSLAISVDGRLVAAAGLRGAVTIVDRATGKTVSTLVGPGLPVWSLAFHPDGKTLYTGGADRMVRKWDIATGQPSQPANAPRADFPASVMNERGAQVFRACEACHTVTPDGGNRAGPTLHGVFGRRIGTARDYAYSEGFAKHDIIWNAETIARLFREGPAAVTPGTKMPEQKIVDLEDLRDLVLWLEKVTR